MYSARDKKKSVPIFQWTFLIFSITITGNTSYNCIKIYQDIFKKNEVKDSPLEGSLISGVYPPPVDCREFAVQKCSGTLNYCNDGTHINGGIDMRVTTKGQVTIPQQIREKMGITTATEIIFLEEKGRVYIAKKPGKKKASPYFKKLRGVASVKMTTDEIMALTRSDK